MLWEQMLSGLWSYIKASQLIAVNDRWSQILFAISSCLMMRAHSNCTQHQRHVWLSVASIGTHLLARAAFRLLRAACE